ncbi:MAG: tetratricopeptide repeat protein, partial [Thermoplasmata archaeon]|nr:tetratricopeptide repeat protein [Thermoplasmata archaeon]NIS10499.1 tetratricopeptide repeat protein [Thermoplasmata archaeon]NIS19645.1 tetratricopeptide repeat protein [Thermoplasmata archaeon]NIT78595.1 tetratricopeptide repeat protein [Thermoplasmata archaeon]NIU50168.1 tetratricopeptide repeat protein [Thermoplasmata archaeon]
SEAGLLRDVLSILDDASGSGKLSPAALDEADLLRGDALAQMDQVDAAHAIYTRVMDRAVAEGDRAQEARVLYRVGLIHSRRGRSEEALEVQRRAITAFEEVDDEAGVGLCRLAVADILVDTEEQDLAVEELGRAHEAFTLVDDRHGVSRSCVKLASIMLDMENPDVARNYLEEAMDNLDSPDVPLLSWVHYYMGEADRMEDQWEGAVGNYERAIEMFQLTGDEHMAANACTYLGDAYQALGDTERAEIYYQRGLDMMVAQ